MKFRYGTEILTNQGEKIAELEQVVIDPKNKQVTHLVAKKGFILTTDKVIPISLVMNATEDSIKLYDFEGRFEDFDDFIELHYVKAKRENVTNPALEEDDEGVIPLYAYLPAGGVAPGFVPVIRYPDGMETKVVKNIPEDEENIPEGAKVLGLEGEHVGNVSEVIIQPTSNQVTHFVVSKGLLFSTDKLIPSAWVRGYDSNELKLVVDSTIIEGLPAYEN